VLQIALANSFITALAGLDASSTKRTASFLDKLIREPDSSNMRPEIVHDAHDRSIRSLRVTNDLRAIVHVGGDQLLLLYVDEHDNAYRWARDRCLECHPVTGELRVVAEQSAAGAHCKVDDGRELCRLLDSAGIEHGLGS